MYRLQCFRGGALGGGTPSHPASNNKLMLRVCTLLGTKCRSAASWGPLVSPAAFCDFSLRGRLPSLAASSSCTFSTTPPVATARVEHLKLVLRTPGAVGQRSGVWRGAWGWVCGESVGWGEGTECAVPFGVDQGGCSQLEAFECRESAGGVSCLGVGACEATWRNVSGRWGLGRRTFRSGGRFGLAPSRISW
jgi:hypothetical protein